MVETAHNPLINSDEQTIPMESISTYISDVEQHLEELS